MAAMWRLTSRPLSSSFHFSAFSWLIWQGPYILHKTAFVRTQSEHMAQLRSYGASRSAQIMDSNSDCSSDVESLRVEFHAAEKDLARRQDSLGNTPWRINGDILAWIKEAQFRDLAIAEVPPKTDPLVARPHLFPLCAFSGMCRASFARVFSQAAGSLVLYLFSAPLLVGLLAGKHLKPRARNLWK